MKRGDGQDLIMAMRGVKARWEDVRSDPTRTALLHLQVALEDAREAARRLRLDTPASEEELAAP